MNEKVASALQNLKSVVKDSPSIIVRNLRRAVITYAALATITGPTLAEQVAHAKNNEDKQLIAARATKDQLDMWVDKIMKLIDSGDKNKRTEAYILINLLTKAGEKEQDPRLVQTANHLLEELMKGEKEEDEFEETQSIQPHNGKYYEVIIVTGSNEDKVKDRALKSCKKIMKERYKINDPKPFVHTEKDGSKFKATALGELPIK